MTGIQTHNGRLNIDGIDVANAAEEFGTPLYIYGGDSIVSGVHTLQKAIGGDVKIYYSIKANPAIGVCALIHQAGIGGAEIASSGELVAALRSGFNAQSILFAGPGKTDAELDHAINHKIGQINTESEHEITRIQRVASQHGIVQRVGVRVNLEAIKAGQGKIKTSGGAQKFGIDDSRVPSAVDQIAQSSNLEFAGLHIMLGSQVLDADRMLTSCKRSIEMAMQVGDQCSIQIPSLNFGGGLGVPHTEDDPQFDLAVFGNGLKNIIAHSRNDPALQHTVFMIEPGRILVSQHGLYLSRVIDVKESGGQTFAILDGGIHHALLPITANSYTIVIADRANKHDTQPVSLGGPLCTSADQWRSQVSLSDVKIGDILAMHNSGAYGLTASMTMFLSKEIPAEVLILNGKCSVIRKRSRPEDVLTGQHIPESLQ